MGRAHIHNSVIPTRSRVAEHEQAFLHEFFGNLQLLVSSLGYRFFDAQRSTPKNQEAYFYIQTARGAHAKALQSNEGMVVLKGSKAADSVVTSTSPWVLMTRQKLTETGVLDEGGIFLEDYTFASPSTAASVIMGRNANGLVEWKDAQKRPLKLIEEA